MDHPGFVRRLQRLAAELRVGGLPVLPHAPLTDESGDVVVPEASAGAQMI